MSTLIDQTGSRQILYSSLERSFPSVLAAFEELIRLAEGLPASKKREYLLALKDQRGYCCDNSTTCRHRYSYTPESYLLP